MATSIKIIVEKHVDGYVAYPVGLKGIVVGQGETSAAALADAKSAVAFHIETFGPDVLQEATTSVLDVFVEETTIAA
ncbi:MAG: type II toxin-antitoxin system HicB family antitoxin [Bacteroidota bacterium]